MPLELELTVVRSGVSVVDESLRDDRDKLARSIISRIFCESVLYRTNTVIHCTEEVFWRGGA